MAKQNTTKAAETDAPKRKVLTAAERVAALEAQLEAAKKKAAEKADKRANELKTKRAALVARRDELNDKIHAINVELGEDDADPESGSDEAPAEDKAS